MGLWPLDPNILSLAPSFLALYSSFFFLAATSLCHDVSDLPQAESSGFSWLWTKASKTMSQNKPVFLTSACQVFYQSNRKVTNSGSRRPEWAEWGQIEGILGSTGIQWRLPQKVSLNWVWGLSRRSPGWGKEGRGEGRCPGRGTEWARQRAITIGGIARARMPFLHWALILETSKTNSNFLIL